MSNGPSQLWVEAMTWAGSQGAHHTKPGLWTGNAGATDGAWVQGQHFNTAGLEANSTHAQRAAFAMRAVRDMEIGKLTAAVAQEDNVIWVRFGHG